MIAAMLGTLCVITLMIVWLVLLVATQGRQRRVNANLRRGRR